MLFQKQHKFTLTIMASVVATLAFGTLSLDAHGMGVNEKIDGLLVDLPDKGVPDGVEVGLSIGRCVLKGTSLTGEGVEAISYEGSTLRCLMFHRVDDVLNAGGWCSQWVVSQAPTPCLDTVKPKKATFNNTGFVYCHKPACALWDVHASGGDGALGFRIKRSFSQYGAYSTIQNETNISYFNVHGSDTNLWWKICGFNEYGETCSDPTRTRAECSGGGGGNPLY